MALEKPEHGREEIGLPDPLPKLIRPDSGQIEKSLGPPFVTKRCRKSGKTDYRRISWRMR